MIKTILIPEERIPVLIGKDGSVKKGIENIGVKINIRQNEVSVVSEDGLKLMTAGNVITAIGRGFSPEKAFKLLDEEKVLQILDLPHRENKLKRIRARLIGEKGKARTRLERLTKTDISVYGKTVSVIGTAENVELCTRAIEKIISGTPHKIVYRFVKARKLKQVD